MSEEATTTDKPDAATAGKEATDAGKSAKGSETVDAKAKTDAAAGADPAKAAVDAGKRTTSVLDDAGDEDDDEPAEDTKKAVAPADWPEDWREKAVAEIKDEKAKAKELKRLQRMKSPADVWKSYRNLEQKVTEEYTRKLPDDATDEQKAEWRKEQGVPDKPDDYKTEVKGHDWTEADEPILKSFLADLHAGDAPQAVVDKALSWYAKHQKAQEEAIYNLDHTDKQEIEDKLRAEWGAEYRGNVNLMARYLKDGAVFPDGYAERIAAARFPDGHRLINDPVIAQWLAGMAREKYGDAALISGDAMSKINSRKAEIEKIRDTDIDKYYRDGLDTELLEIERREAGRGGKRAA